jgi:hypothetical protein
MADLLPISERLYDLSILLVFRFDDTYEHDVLLNHHIPVEEDNLRTTKYYSKEVIGLEKGGQELII